MAPPPPLQTKETGASASNPESRQQSRQHVPVPSAAVLPPAANANPAMPNLLSATMPRSLLSSYTLTPTSLPPFLQALQQGRCPSQSQLEHGRHLLSFVNPGVASLLTVKTEPGQSDHDVGWASSSTTNPSIGTALQHKTPAWIRHPEVHAVATETLGQSNHDVGLASSSTNASLAPALQHKMPAWSRHPEVHAVATETLGQGKCCNKEEAFAVELLLRKAFSDVEYNAGSNRNKKLFALERKAPFKGMECLASHTCKAPGCDYEARVMRTSGALLLFEKGSHDVDSHYRSPVKKPGSRSTMMKPVARKYLNDNLHVNPVTALVPALRRNNLLTTDQRGSNVGVVEKQVQNYVYKQRQKTKGTGDFTSVLHLKEMLDRASVGNVPDFLLADKTTTSRSMALEDAPINELPPGMGILHHNVGVDLSGKWDTIVFVLPGIAETLAGADLMAKHPFRVGKGLQGEIDFAKGFIHSSKQGGVKNSHQVGAFGICDFVRRFFPVLLVISKSENTTSSTHLVKSGEEFVSHGTKTHLQRILKDLGKALAAATRNCGLDGRNCVAHQFRGPEQRGGGRKGSMGSLQRFLNDANKKLKKESRRFILESCALTRFLRTVLDYCTARVIFIEELELLESTNDPNIGCVKANLLTTYLPEDPCYGLAGHVIGEPLSTQGGERWWRTNKELLKILEQNRTLTTTDAIKVMHSTVATTRRLPTFQAEPKKDRWIYELLKKFACSAGVSISEYRLAYYFVNGKGVKASDCVGEGMDYSIYVPTRFLIDKLKHAVSKLGAESVETLEELDSLSAFSQDDRLATNPTMCQAYISLQDKCLAENVTTRNGNESLEEFMKRRAIRDSAAHWRSEKDRRKAVLWSMHQKGRKENGEIEVEDDAQAAHEMQLMADKNCDSEASESVRTKRPISSISQPTNGKQARSSTKDDSDPFENLCFASMLSLGTRQLGHFVKVDVHTNEDGSLFYVACDCERALCTGNCIHICLYEVVHGKYPSLENIVNGEEWDKFAKSLKSKLCDHSYYEGRHAPPNRNVPSDPLYVKE